jgi:hypothetical protein
MYQEAGFLSTHRRNSGIPPQRVAEAGHRGLRPVNLLLNRLRVGALGC